MGEVGRVSQLQLPIPTAKLLNLTALPPGKLPPMLAETSSVPGALGSRSPTFYSKISSPHL